MIASLRNIDKFYNGNQILKNIDLVIENNDRIGLVGVNGCGKSTLLRIITGKEYPDNGDVSVSNGCTIGFLEQDTGLDKSNTVIEEMNSVFEKLHSIQHRMREIESRMAEIPHDTDEYKEISDEYAHISAYFEASDGYILDVKIKTILNGMGFSEERYDRIISTLSGGEKTRLAISKLLLENPDLLILDEPTNHLDFDTIMWLEDYLKTYKGAVLLVSHDRYFLDQLVSSVAEIEFGKLARYKGNYSAFALQKEMNLQRQAKEYEQQQKEIAQLKEYVDKNLVRASTSKMAKSRQNMLDRMEIIEKPITDIKAAKLRFTYEADPPKDVLTVKNIDLTVGKGSGKKILSENVSFEVKRGDKVALVGENGTGKSTLLKVIQKKLPCSKGLIEWTKNVKISYFEQENAQLDTNKTVFDEFHSRFPYMTDHEVRSCLGSVRLTGENVFKNVGVISGGERAKLCFAIIMQEHSNVLILDEPTNHLDLATKEELEKALAEYEGTLILVSHDRYLLDKIADKIIEIRKNEIEIFNYGFKQYMDEKRRRRSEAEQKLAEQKMLAQKEKQTEKNVKLYRTREQRNADAQRKKKIKELEILIDEIQLKVDHLEKEITEPEVIADYQLLNEKCTQITELKQQISDHTDEWFILCEDQ